MDWWIRWAYEHSPAFIRNAVTYLVKFVMGVAGIITDTLRGNKSAWLRLHRYLTQFRTGFARFMVAVTSTLGWLRNTFIPRIVRLFVDALARHVGFLFSLAYRAFRAADALIDRAWRAATALLARAIGLLRQWAQEAIAAVWRVIPDAIRRAWRLLLSPRTLAEWVAGALWFALLRLANREAERIVRWLRDQSVRFTVEFARFIEGILVRLL